jgi:assimilatory nitrate reductase catalytic subunit
LPVRPNPVASPDAAFPLILNTGRVRDHWHTMTRTGRSPRLSQHLAEPYVEMHREDAQDAGLADADLVRVSSRHGWVLVRALLSPRQRKGTVFVPMHWTDQFAARARIDALVPGDIDPNSGQPGLKHVPVRIEPFAAAKYGFAVLRERPLALYAPYWAIAKCEGGCRLELAFAEDGGDWLPVAASLFNTGAGAEILAYHDAATGAHRFACFEAERLVGALFLASGPVAVSRAWVCEQLLRLHPGQRARMAVIAGRPGDGIAERGAIVCSCFGVGSNEIEDAVAKDCLSVEAVGAALQAGTNCGSCRGEIANIINERRRKNRRAAGTGDLRVGDGDAAILKIRT